jgi:hypothetical protein
LQLFNFSLNGVYNPDRVPPLSLMNVDDDTPPPLVLMNIDDDTPASLDRSLQ